MRNDAQERTARPFGVGFGQHTLRLLCQPITLQGQGYLRGHRVEQLSLRRARNRLKVAGVPEK